MSEENEFTNSKVKNAMDEMMKSEEGRALAEQLRDKLKELNNQFKGLDGDEKKKFLSEFREKFSEKLGDLKDSLNINLGESENGQFKFHNDEGSVPPPVAYTPNYLTFIVAILLVVLLFG